MKIKLINKTSITVFITVISMLFFSCNIFFPKKEDKTLLALASLYKYQRPYGVYISGKLIDASNNAIPNATVTITGRNENSTQVRAGSTSNEGFYAGIISTTTTAYGSFVNASNSTYSNGTPSTFLSKYSSVASTVSTVCGSSVSGLSSTYDTNNRRVVCDTSTLDSGAQAVGINTSTQATGSVIATFTTDSTGAFYTSFLIPSVGNTYTVTVTGVTKTRRLRIGNSGTGGLLRNFCPTAATTGCTTALEASNIDFLQTTALQESSSNEGFLDATSSAQQVGFNFDPLVIEIEYPRNLISLEGTLNKDETIPSGYNVLLSGTVVVPNGITLTINSGSTIYGSASPGGALLVKPGGKLIAVGTENSPIVFTSEKGLGFRQPGDWQGIILQGNGCQTFGGLCSTAVGEGDVGTYGGNDNTGTCGTLKYVRIEFAGAPFSPGNERNGLSLMGCGSGTSVQYVQVHRSYDDAFEIWGGAPQFKYVVSSSARDDNFDFADGTVMKMQYGIVLIDSDSVKVNDDTSRCIEGDGNTSQTCSGSARSGGTCSDPYFANITCVGPSSGTNLGEGIFVRRSSNNKTGDFGNILIDGLSKYANCSTASATGAFIKGVYGSNGSASSMSCTGFTALSGSNSVISKIVSTPDFSPSASNTGITSLKSSNGNFNDSFFDDTTFYGAVEFGGTKWWEGWTSFPLN
jgi:hypothetical protein